MQFSVIAIGDELLIGQVTDTNSGMIARTLAPYGWELRETLTVGDYGPDIIRAIERQFETVDVIITTGGLGPTKDDLTKQVMCEYFGGELYEDPEVTRNIMEILERRGIELNALTAAQALVPTSCQVIRNRVGTAPVMWFERPDGKLLVAMPGVPFETATVLPEEVIPRLLARYPSDVTIAHEVLMVTGLTESALAERLTEFENQLPACVHLAYLPKPGLIRLRLDGHHTDAGYISAEVKTQAEKIAAILGPSHLLAMADMTAAEMLLQRLRHEGLTVATAESCTGGNIAHRLTLIPGASDVVAGGVVSYSNEVKMRALGVRADTLAAHGAVSEQTVEEMTEGVMRLTGATLAIATSGIAGPGGGSPEKPVGTVWMAVRTPHRVVTSLGHFTGSRSRIIDTATTHALLLAVQVIDGTR